jgi:hypothetical protein
VNEEAQWLTPWAVLGPLVEQLGFDRALQYLCDRAAGGKLRARADTIHIASRHEDVCWEDRDVSPAMWPSIAGDLLTVPDWQTGDFDFRHHDRGLGWLVLAVRGMRIDPASAGELVRGASPSNDPGEPAVSAPATEDLSPRRGYTRHDRPLVEEMRQIVLSEGIMPWPAAQKVVSRAAGNSAEESKLKRLVALYQKLYPE